MNFNHERLNAAFCVVLTKKVDGRPATPDELNEAHLCIFAYNVVLATRILRALGVASVRHDAEEIAQQFAILTCLGLHQYAPDQPAKAFAAGVIRMLCFAHARKNRRMTSLPDGFDIASGQATYEDRLVLTEVLMFVVHAMTRLTEQQHRAITDQFWSALTAHESTPKGQTRRSTESARHRARAILVRAFKEFGVDDWAWKLFS